MVDDYKYSIGRHVVYRHPSPRYPRSDYGQYGPARTVGLIRGVEGGSAPDHVWIYTIENVRTGEITRVGETDIFHATAGKRERRPRSGNIDLEQLAEELTRTAPESALADYLRFSIEEFRRREESEERARREGRELPVHAGDYIRVRGELREEIASCHNHYAKVLEVGEPDIAAIESTSGNYRVRNSYRVQLDDGRECMVYDPEIKLYYTAEGRRIILNWRAAKFLAESFQDDPPYSVEYSYLEDHVFSRDELEAMSVEQLRELFAALLYVKGRMGLRDLENSRRHLQNAPKEFLVDSALAVSRFDMQRNRSLTPGEVENKRREIYRLRRLLRGH